MEKKRIPALLLAVLLTVSATSCSSGDDKTADEATTTASTITESETAAPRDSLPELDFNGTEVTIYAASDLPVIEFDAEQTGDIVSDAVFARNLAVAERLNIKLGWYMTPGLWADQNSFKGVIRSAIQAGEQAYDIVAGYGVFISDLAVEQLFGNLTDTKYIDFNQPWWSDSLVENLSVNGKLYFASGDISTNTIGTSFSVIFHKKLLENYKLDNPYEIVDAGQWTIDRMFGMASEIYTDLNGNDKRDEEDFYGLYSQVTSFDNFYYSCGMSCVIPDGVGGMKVSEDFGSQKMSTLVEKMCNAFHNTVGCNFGDEDGPPVKSFINGNTIFFLSGLKVASTSLRDTEFEYGVLPTPKWDETQEQYRSTTSYLGSLYSIPLDAADADMSSAIMEALAIEGYYELAPAFFETALKVKYSSDNDSARMYDIIRSSVTYDFGRVFSMGGLNSIPGKIRSMVSGNDTNWASAYAANIDTLETKLAELVEKFAG